MMMGWFFLIIYENGSIKLSYMKIKGYDGVNIARKLYFYKYDGYIKALRRANGTETIDRNQGDNCGTE